MINEYVVKPSLCAAYGMFVNTYMNPMSHVTDEFGDEACILPAVMCYCALEVVGVAPHNVLAFVLGFCYAPLAVENMAEVLTHDLTQLIPR